MAYSTPQIGERKSLILKDILDLNLEEIFGELPVADAKNRFMFVARKIFREYRQNFNEHLSGVVNFNFVNAEPAKKNIYIFHSIEEPHLSSKKLFAIIKSMRLESWILDLL